MCRILLAAGLMMLVASGYAKDARTYYDEAMMTRMQEKVAKYDWAKSQVKSAEAAVQWYMEMSDQELWDLVPPPEQLRAINVSHGVGCPYCGDEIIRKAGHYPWKMSRDKPFKVTCPVCDRTFPENDFVPWNTAGKDGEPEKGRPITDKGVGWVDEDGHRYYFVAYHMFWQRWSRDIIGGMRSLGQAYLLTDNPVYARKAAVMMCKLAGEYERFDYPTQCYHEGIWGVNGRISDYIWTTGNDSTIALAYDAIYPVFDKDKELFAFLKDKGIGNPREHIEQKMLQLMADDILTGYAKGNMGAHQRTMCHLALALDNDDPEKGHTTEEAREWLMKGEGRIEDLLWNGFWRDGLGSESSPSYSSGWCSSFYGLADMLPRLGIEIWENPKLKKMADIGLDMTVAGEWTPCIGDCGGVMGAKRIAWSPTLQGRAFMHYGDVKYAKALGIMNATSRNLWEDLFDEEAVAKVIEKEGKELDWKTRSIGGYGLAILEAGSGDNRRGVSMYYGDATGGHGHRDRLTLSMFAYGYPMLNESGYPTPFRTPKRAGWNSNTISHYSVLVDEAPHACMNGGDLNTLAASPGVQLMDASAEIAYGEMTPLYRRTCALIDISDQNSYLLDIFRVRGGRQHDWSFHGPAHFSDFTVSGGQLGPLQEKGTLAGENVEFGKEIPLSAGADSWTLPLVKAEGLVPGTDYGPLSKQGWARFGSCILTRMKGAEVRFKVDPPMQAGKVKIHMHIYDYNAGNNVVDIGIGKATASLLVEPSGTVGYRWVSGVCELPEDAGEVTLAAQEVGQKYIQIDNLVITTDLLDRAPIVRDRRRSGFNYIFNVRRMKPQGMWSATWRKLDEDVAMTVTMPAGCTQEVIAGDAIPELQPGNPETMQYVLGRNALPDDAAGEERLFSTYTAVVEPHRGEAAVTGVENLKADTASAETVAVAVAREGATDYVHSSLSPDERCEWTGPGLKHPLVVTAEFAMLTLDGRGVRRAVVVNGTLLEYGDFALKPSPSPEGPVLSVDFASNSITLDTMLTQPDAFRDNVVMLGNELQSTNYMITDAKTAGGKTTLSFGNVLFIMAMGEVAEIDENAKVITSDRPLAGYGHVDGGRHAGRWLYNDDKSQGFRIASIGGKKLTLEGVEGDLSAIFNDRNGDGRAQYWVSDIGPGDTFRLPVTTYYSR